VLVLAVTMRFRRGTALKRAALVVAAVVLALVVASAAEANAGAAEAKSRDDRVSKVTARIWLAQVGPACHFCYELINYPSAYLEIQAYDVDPTTAPCFGCPTADKGSITYDWPGVWSFGPATIDWVDVYPDGTAVVNVGEFFFTLVDGGVPGAAITGPPGPTGVAPTLDHLAFGTFFSGHVLDGWVQKGNINIRYAVS
jgi:hypothetical protein